MEHDIEPVCAYRTGHWRAESPCRPTGQVSGQRKDFIMTVSNQIAEKDALSIMLPLLSVVIGAGTLVSFVVSLCAGLG